ncbi:hypothetical protein DB88DRAFT_126350 [Papiliotrema laurentii]|uniref:Uncharacterized protein n=1 Tax=Papiliotrema laurentii TaxID=5418 RepID=A0AAD9FLF9_PAPLA|nr:hypothetical protein DB88DRAFT_126350 [Papiliotrema laurentii]
MIVDTIREGLIGCLLRYQLGDGRVWRTVSTSDRDILESWRYLVLETYEPTRWLDSRHSISPPITTLPQQAYCIGMHTVALYACTGHPRPGVSGVSDTTYPRCALPIEVVFVSLYACYTARHWANSTDCFSPRSPYCRAPNAIHQSLIFAVRPFFV